MAHNYGFALDPGWKVVLADVGVRHQDVLRRAELPDDLLARENVRLRTDEFFRFCQAVEDEVDDPRFPLQMGRTMSADWFSPPLFAALCSPSLTVAAKRLSRFKPLIAPLYLHVHDGPTGLRLDYEWMQSAYAPPRSFVGAEAVFIVQLARIGTRTRIAPVALSMPELPEPLDEYQEFLGVRIGVGPLGVTFSREDADRAFLTANTAMWEVFEPELRRRLEDLEGNATYAQRTRSVLLEALPSGQFAIDRVARRLAVSSRTLQRRLRQEGTSYQDLVKQVREELARHYLSRTHLSSSEIAFLLGFEEPSSFFRAFHTWTGQTPETVRQAMVH